MPRSDRGLPILLRRLTKFKAMVSASAARDVIWTGDRIPVVFCVEVRDRVWKGGIGWRDGLAAWRKR
jgi:hypothetical protein